MKTEWRPRTYKKFPGWGCRAIVTGGYATSSYKEVAGKERQYIGGKWAWVTITRKAPIRAPILVRYEITFNGVLFFSVAQRKQALPLISKYNKEMKNA